MGKLKIILVSLPLAVATVLVKLAMHALGWEPFNATMMPIFTTTVTGIIFLLGFILAGVMADYKESEKIPGEMTASLYSLWMEMEIAAQGAAGEKARAFQRQLLAFAGSFRVDMLLRRDNQKALDLLDSFAPDIHALDKDLPPPFMSRVRNEQANLRKHLIRIGIIRDTDFAVSVSILVRGIVSIFLASLLLLRFEPVYIGSFFCFFYSFVLFSILRVIADMDDPFEYKEGVKSADEIDFSPFFQLEEKMRRTLDNLAG